MSTPSASSSQWRNHPARFFLLDSSLRSLDDPDFWDFELFDRER
jgi:hypothetical protein